MQPDNSLPLIGSGLTKSELGKLADSSVDAVLEEGNVFQVAEALAAMEEFTKAVRKDERYIHFLRDELYKNHGQIVTTSGAKIEACEAGVSYDYSHDSEWRALDAEIRNLTERKKALEERLRALRPGQMAVDEETGEVIEGAKRSSRSTYRITLKR